MAFIGIDSRRISDKIFDRYQFSPAAKNKLRGAFKGEVSLERFRPRKLNSQAIVLQAAYDKSLQIPTSKEWSAIVLAAETMSEESNRDAEKLLNDETDGMLHNGLEITSTALFYLPGKKTPSFVIDNLFFPNQTLSRLTWFPVSRKPFLHKGKEIQELGIPSSARTHVSVPKEGGLVSISRGYVTRPELSWPLPLHAYWGPLTTEPDMGSRVITRRK